VTLPSKSHSIANYHHKTVIDKKEKITSSQKASQHKTSSEKQHSDNTIVKAASPENIVSFSGIHFTAFIYYNFCPEYPKVLAEIGMEVPKLLFILSYFENTFCHHIAINAP
jgi:hypothetical protein